MNVRGNPAGPNLAQWEQWAAAGDSYAEEAVVAFERAVEWANDLTDEEADWLIEKEPTIFLNWQVAFHFPISYMKQLLKEAREEAGVKEQGQAKMSNLAFDCPPLAETLRRMMEVLAPGSRADVAIPSSLADNAHFIEQYQRGTGDLFRLRPDQDKTRQHLVDLIGNLPQAPSGTFWDNHDRGRLWPTPQVIGENAPFQTYFLAADREDTIQNDGELLGLTRQTPWVWGDRGITPLYEGGSSWLIGSVHPAFGFILRRDATGNREYDLQGEIELPDPTLPGHTFYWGCHPDRLEHEADSPPHLNLAPTERPDDMGSLQINGTACYGAAWLSVKKLGFFGALEVAINWIECLEWAYGVAERPVWLPEVG